MLIAIGVVRVWSASGELWLDEIWSFRLVRFLQTPIGILTDLHHDNNHHLNSLYLYFLPESAHPILWRLPSILAGLGATILAAGIARRAGTVAALTASLFVGGSFLLVLYGSEARGYSLAVFFAFLAIPLGERYLAGRQPIWAAAFVLSVTLGVLSHLTFLHAYLGLVAWTAFRARGRGGWRGWSLAMASMHLLPAGVLAALYAVDLRSIDLGGGPQNSIGEIVTRTLSLGVGGPDEGPWALAAAAAAGLAGLLSLFRVRRSGSDLWILFAVTAIVSPVLTLMTVDTSLLFERYFLVAMAFLLLSFSWTVAAVATRSRLAALALAAAFLAGNAEHAWRLMELGRGSYRSALAFAVNQSRQPLVTIGADHDFRNGAVVEFYRLKIPDGGRIRFQERSAFSGDGPEWFLVHSARMDFDPRPSLTLAGRWRYTLAAVYRSAGVSGWHLALYHNVVN